MKSNADGGRVLLVWDADVSPPVGDWITVLWSGFEKVNDRGIISIPMLVEARADALRAHYLAWIYELGETRINGKRLVDHLDLREGFSAWWMTLLTEKCNFAKSPQIDDAIRLIAFENWATGCSFGSVVLASANQSLAEGMRSWCANMGFKFEWQRMPDKTEKLSWTKRLHKFLPHPLQALIWLVRYLAHRWSLRGVGLREWRETEGRATFVSYLDNLVPDAAKDGRFESRYWAHLPDDLQHEGCKTNWLHLYVKDASLPTTGKAADAIRKFNKTGQGGQAHVTLDAFLSARVVIRTLLDWGRLVCKCRRLRQAISLPREAALDLWPFFREDWRCSMYGRAAINNLLYYNLFESALKSLPKQQVGVYLQENQGWEFALIHSWKAAGHGQIIGYPHSTVRYWDLRYFFDPHSYNRAKTVPMPLPDKVAVNGPEALAAYRRGGYPEDDLVEVEALRYLHLVETKTERNSVLPPSSAPVRVLVLGDYLLSNTCQQLLLLEKAAQRLPEDTIITVKPHPNCPVQPMDYPGLRMEVTMEPVAKLLADCDVAYTSSATSAAVDAYCTGVPVVSVLDPNTLNLSPLRGCGGVLFASSSEELASALLSAASSTRSARGQQDFFTLDPKLPRWRKLLMGLSSL